MKFSLALVLASVLAGSTTNPVSASPAPIDDNSPSSLNPRAVNFRVRRGLGAWAADSRWSPNLLKGYFEQTSAAAASAQKGWYHHWQDGPLTELANTNLEYVPNYWGPQYAALWAQREAEMVANGLPKAIMAQNEIDVVGQANLNASAAAQGWNATLAKYQDMGVRISSPQIVWNITLLNETMNILKTQYNRSPDFIAIHWYGAWNNTAGFQKYVKNVHSAFPTKPIWLTEIGVTSASNGTQAQVKSFHSAAFNWLETQSYVERATIFGMFAVTSPPDDYATKFNALFNTNGTLRDLAYWYMWG